MEDQDQEPTCHGVVHGLMGSLPFSHTPGKEREGCQQRVLLRSPGCELQLKNSSFGVVPQIMVHGPEKVPTLQETPLTSSCGLGTTLTANTGIEQRWDTMSSLLPMMAVVESHLMKQILPIHGLSSLHRMEDSELHTGASPPFPTLNSGAGGGCGLNLGRLWITAATSQSLLPSFWRN